MPNINAATKALFGTRPDDQVLTLDWSPVADTGPLGALEAESSIVPVAEWAASALTQYGISGTT
jgi:hypothetical protein